MPNSPNASVRLSIGASLLQAKTLGNLVWRDTFVFEDSLFDGSNAGQIQVIYSAERTIASGATDDFDLSPLVDPIGTSSTPVELVGIMVVNKPADPGAVNTTNITLGGHPTAALTAFMTATSTIGPIRPNGIFFMLCDDAAGLGAITATTADTLRIVNSAGAQAKIQVIIFARTA